VYCPPDVSDQCVELTTNENVPCDSVWVRSYSISDLVLILNDTNFDGVEFDKDVDVFDQCDAPQRLLEDPTNNLRFLDSTGYPDCIQACMSLWGCAFESYLQLSAPYCVPLFGLFVCKNIFFNPSGYGCFSSSGNVNDCIFSGTYYYIICG